MKKPISILIVICAAAIGLSSCTVTHSPRESEAAADLIIINGRVYRADGRTDLAEALAARGNTIFRVGSDQEINSLRGPQTLVIDAHGGTVLPGFNDSHMHFLSGSLGLSEINLLDCVNVDEIGAAVRKYAASNKGIPWIIGRGWYYTAFPGGLPPRGLLDKIVSDRPAYLTAYDGHSGWANTAAMKLANIARSTPDPANGIIVKDDHGEPTGVLKESAQELMRKVLPKPDRTQKLAAILKGIREAHRLGITSVQNAHGSAEEIGLWDELRRRHELTLRMYHSLSADPGLSENEADKFDEVRRTILDDPFLKTGAIKLMLDGVIEAHTAVMLEPYANRPTKGIGNFTPQELNRTVALFDKRGWQIWIHAIGDGAIRMSLDAFEAAARANPVPSRGRRHRIEHIESIDPADVPRFGALGVIASMQPFHANPDPAMGSVWGENIGPDRASHGWLWHSIAQAGGRLTFGSDWPVVTMDSFVGLQVAVNRLSPKGEPAGGWLPEQKLPLTVAIDAYTRGAAFASFEEQRKGSLSPGMLADIVILSTDIFAAKPERVLDAKVNMTIFDGKVVYQRAASAIGTGATPARNRMHIANSGPSHCTGKHANRS